MSTHTRFSGCNRWRHTTSWINGVNGVCCISRTV